MKCCNNCGGPLFKKFCPCRSRRSPRPRQKVVEGAVTSLVWKTEDKVTAAYRLTYTGLLVKLTDGHKGLHMGGSCGHK